ncbi:MAG TPA: hypothetical protein VEW08_17725 [Steroidobacteraceae bacterium]|nr:hypothetical protein [Steroidobacteraceae bacterium]
MIRKLLLTSLGCLYAASALGVGACQGQACRYTSFGKDADGCLEIRNLSREDIEVTVYTAASGTYTVRVAGGDTEKIYKTGRMCVPAADYLRSGAEYAGGIFSPSR